MTLDDYSSTADGTALRDPKELVPSFRKLFQTGNFPYWSQIPLLAPYLHSPPPF